MIYFYILLLLIAVPLILMMLSFVVGGIIIGALGTVIMGFIRLFGKKQPLPYNLDVFPIIPEEKE